MDDAGRFTTLRRSTAEPEVGGGLRTDLFARQVPYPQYPNTVRVSPTAVRPGLQHVPAVRRINPTHMTGLHDWTMTPAPQRDYGSFVYEDQTGRLDVQRFRDMERLQGRRDADAEYRAFRQAHRWFTIPRTIRTDRSLARDEQDAAYVDRMDTFIARAVVEGYRMRMRLIPMIANGDALMSRWWNQFRFALPFVTEAVWRGLHGLMVPADAETVDTTTANVSEYMRIFPPTPEWYTEEWFPTGVPAPTPPSVFYYHREITRTREPRLRSMWNDIIMLEWAALFTAGWWHDARRGRRAWVVPLETVDWLRDLLDDIIIDPDPAYADNRPARATLVLEAMEAAARSPETERNTVFFTGTRLRPSQFVWTTQNTGFIDAAARAQRQFTRGRSGNGRLTELNVARDPYGYRPRLNHARPPPERQEERPAQRRRLESDVVQEFRPVPVNPPQQPPRRAPMQQNGPPPMPFNGQSGRDGPAVPYGPRHPVTDARHPADAMTPRQAVYRHIADTEEGREEVFIDEWRRRYGEPTRADVVDARIATPAEDRAVRNGRLPAWSQRGVVRPGMRPRLVLSDNPRARRRPVRGGNSQTQGRS